MSKAEQAEQPRGALLKPDSAEALRAVRIPSRELQELWFATLRRPWRALAVVPSGPGIAALPLANALANVGAVHRGRPLRVMSAEGLGLDGIAELAIELQVGLPGPLPGDEPGVGAASNEVVIALESIITNPLGTALALAADAVVLVVEYGKSDLTEARRTIEQIGPDRFVGCVVVGA